MNPISRTAFYTCGVRMQDAEHNNSVCGDIYAESFMNEDGRQILESFKDETGPNASTIARHRIIDDFLRRELLVNPDLQVLLIGAGFDSRAFRLKGGNWLELDEPQVIEYKNECLPHASCENKLQRISTELLAEKLSEFSIQSPIVVVIEGVFMYLDVAAIKRMIDNLRQIFPQYKLVGDLMNRKFFEKYGKTLHEKLTGMGASFKFTIDDPEKLFLENGYRRAEKTSIIEKAVEFGLLKIPKIALKTLLRTLRDGNAIFVFETL
jgi:methyltransferase (TIGR00027 family)